MAIKPKSERKIEKPVIDLSGPDGNAFYLIAQAEKLGRRWGMNTIDIVEEIQDGDYENLIKTFDKYFGNCVDLQR